MRRTILIAIGIAVLVGGVLWWRASRAGERTGAGLGPRGLPTRAAPPAQ